MSAHLSPTIVKIQIAKIQWVVTIVIVTLVIHLEPAIIVLVSLKCKCCVSYISFFSQTLMSALRVPTIAMIMLSASIQTVVLIVFVTQDTWAQAKIVMVSFCVYFNF